MDFSLTPEQQAFRHTVRAWLKKNIPSGWKHLGSSEIPRVEAYELLRKWQRTLYDAGFIGLTWPKEYGGRGLTFLEEMIAQEEMALAKAPPILNVLGVGMAGPTIIACGTEAQKQRYPSKILACEEIWCQGYSEPNSGSDLASLQTRADLDGDHYVVNGQKIWTSYANKADWIFCLTRTDFSAKKHEGISFLLFDMASPGVSTKPILLISGNSPFCETFFDNVRVPKQNVLGTVNKGWDVAKYVLQFERDSISGIGDRGSKRSMSEIATSSVGVDKEGRLADPLMRAQLAKFEV